MRNQEKGKQQAEKWRDEFVDEIHPIPSDRWIPKQVKGTTSSMTIIAAPTPSTSALTLLEEKSMSIATSSTPSPTLSSVDEILESVSPTPENDEEMVDFENTPVREGIDMNMVYCLPANFRAVDEEGEVAQLDFGPKNAIFEKPKELVKHLKPLYVKGHINGSPVARMLVDGGAVVNLMPYSVFEKLGLDENDLMKTNMVLNGFESKEKTKAKGFMSVELTVGSKTLATAFFIAEVQGN
jgi:hypothetical protein